MFQHLCQEIKTYLKASSVEGAGVGVFAIVDIPKNTTLFRYPLGYSLEQTYITKAEAKKLPEHVQFLLKRFIVPGKTHYPLPKGGLNAIDQSFYLNHSKTPNVGLRDGELWMQFYTLRSIKKEEELYIDYSTFCECGKLTYF